MSSGSNLFLISFLRLNFRFILKPLDWKFFKEFLNQHWEVKKKKSYNIWENHGLRMHFNTIAVIGVNWLKCCGDACQLFYTSFKNGVHDISNNTCTGRRPNIKDADFERDHWIGYMSKNQRSDAKKIHVICSMAIFRILWKPST